MSRETIDYTVRRSDRARRVRVTVHPRGEVEVVLPRRARDREAAAAIEELRPWIERRLAEAVVVRERIAERGATVPFLGQALRLVAEPGRTRAHRRDDALLVPAGDAGPAIERWYRRMARSEFRWRLDEAAADLGVTYAGVRIGNQQTRWGSCSASGAMSFNWRLLMAPEEILDYVVEHEVAHLDVQDHSKRFWRLLGSRWPDWREHEAWLRRHGHALRLG